MIQFWLGLGVVLLSSTKVVAGSPYVPGELLIRNVTVLDMISDEPLEKRDVWIKDGRISKISRTSRKQPRDSILVIDGRGKYLSPGFIDSHTHLIDSHSPNQRNISFLEDELQMLLLNGVTSVRNMKNFVRQLTLSREIESRQRFAPRIFVASSAISDRQDLFAGVDASIHHACNPNWSNCSIRGEQGAVEIVQKFAREGFHAIKVREPMAAELLYPLVREIKKAGLPVVGHVQDVSAFPKVFAENLFDSIEHATDIFGYLEAQDSPLRQAPYNSDLRVRFLYLRSFHVDFEVKKKLLQLAGRKFKGVFVPTLAAGANYLKNVAGPRDLLSEANQELIDSCWKTKQNAAALKALETNREYQNFRGPNTFVNSFSNVKALVGEFHRAGVKIATGTDFGIDSLLPGFSLHDEMQLLSESGLSPIEVLRAATLHGAELLRDSQLGKIKKGAKADLVLLDANPLDRIENTRKIGGVIRDGVWLDRAKLTSIAEGIQQRAAAFQCAP
jgi:hypothetical protein